MGGGASTARQPLHALSADGVLELVEGIGPSYSDLAKQLHELGYDGEFLAKASEDDLTEIFDELEVPKLKQCVMIGHPQIRNRGTVGGSMVQADPAAEYPAVAVALGADLVARGAGGERVMAADDFFITYLTTALEPPQCYKQHKGDKEWKPEQTFNHRLSGC